MLPVQFSAHLPFRSRSVSRVVVAGVLASVSLTVPATSGADVPSPTRAAGSTSSGSGPISSTGTRLQAEGTSRVADSAGTATLGTAAYAVPAGAVVVSPTGSDAAAGTLASPVRTLGRALVLAPAGGTVVLRAGTYTESVTASKTVTIQNYPREKVWFDGSVPVGGWVKDGTTWRRDGWTKRFDASVGFSKGDVDGTAAGWRWLNPDYPMAAHPDQVWVNGTQLRQVSSRAAVGAGRFFLDRATSRLYIGSSPTGVQVRVSSLEKAMRIVGAGSVVRGIGIRRYAPSIWHIGSVTIEAPKVRFENVLITDSSTIGLGVVREDAVLTRVSVLRAGLLGIHAATADRIRVVRSRIDGNNSERFNPAPVSGGIKAGRSRGVTVVDSSVSNNLGQGYWSDVSVYDTKILNSNISGNRAAGVFLEIGARGTVVNNLISDNGGDGVKINNTSKVVIYNNTVVRNGRPINIVQDPRRPSNTSYGDDHRYPNDPEMTWLIGPVTVRNNVIGLTHGQLRAVRRGLQPPAHRRPDGRHEQRQRLQPRDVLELDVAHRLEPRDDQRQPGGLHHALAAPQRDGPGRHEPGLRRHRRRRVQRHPVLDGPQQGLHRGRGPALGHRRPRGAAERGPLVRRLRPHRLIRPGHLAGR